LFIALLVCGSSAGAAEPVRFEYRAPARCPDQAAFVERVRVRLQRGKLASPGELARVFTITVASSGSSSTAEVEFVDVSGERVVRAVSGETCDEVISGIALVTALAIDARAGAEEERPAEPAPSPRRQPAEPVSEARRETVPDRTAVTTPRPPLRWEVGVTGGANTWSAPEPAFGAGAFGEADFGAPPLRYVRLSVLRTNSTAFVDSRSARFTSTLARLSACPVSLTLLDPLALVPCLGADLGALAGEGTRSESLPNPGEDTIFLPVGLLSAEFRYGLGGFLMFEARGELGFPLRRQTFKFDDRTEPVFEIPDVGYGAGLSIGLCFP
jgi:hypothetical protein